MRDSVRVMRRRCEAPGCTAAARCRGEAGVRDAGVELELRDRLCLCAFHYRAIADGVVGCWGEPPLGVVWRLGRGEGALWYQNERRLTPEQIEPWLRAEGRAAE